MDYSLIRQFGLTFAIVSYFLLLPIGITLVIHEVSKRNRLIKYIPSVSGIILSVLILLFVPIHQEGNLNILTEQLESLRLFIAIMIPATVSLITSVIVDISWKINSRKNM